MSTSDIKEFKSFLLKQAQYKNESSLPVSWIHITTITMIMKLNNTIDLLTVKQFIGSGKLLKRNSKHKGFMWEVKNTPFYNQATLVYSDHISKKSVKLFHNGSVQVTGCSSIHECHSVRGQILAILNTSHHGTPFEIAPMKIVMINTNFGFNFMLNLRRVQDAFQMYSVTFDPDRYSAVKVKMKPMEDMKEVTCSIFGTGKVIITGATNLREVVEAYRVIISVVRRHLSDIRVKDVEKIQMNEKFMGTTYDQCLEVMRKNTC